MKTRFVFLVKYFLYWLLFFTFARFLFMAYEYHQTFQINASEWWGIIIRGAWMDVSMIGYILLVTGVILVLHFYSKGEWIVSTLKYFTIFLLIVFSFIVVGDVELYRNWGFRIDATPFLYLGKPGEAFASVKPLLIFALVALTALLVIVFFMVYQKWVLNERTIIKRGTWWYIPIFLFFSATMIIPMRGGFGIAPMNSGKVYFSQNMYCNHAALNAGWNLMASLTKSSAMYKRYPDYIDRAKGKTIASRLMEDTGINSLVLKNNRPNIVILLLESFSSKMIEPLGGLPNITPNLNRLSKEGIIFSKIFASGDRSDKGIVAVLSGFPAQSTSSIIKYPLKSQKLPTFSGMLDSSGYHNAFYYGGDPDFANIRSYLFSSKFRTIITQDDFPKSFRNSKWGVHDEYVFQRLLADCDSAKAPFFKMFFTLTSHEPFEMPTKPKFKGVDEQTKFLSSVYYTDSCIGAFFNNARTKDWYKNTLFILIADHGHRLPGNDPNYVINKFKIPMIWLGGALSVDSLNITSTGSQVDLAATLLCQLGYKTNRFKFSKDLLSNGSKSFAYYAFNDGFGFVTDSSYVIFDHTSRKMIEKKGVNTDKITEQAYSFFSAYQEVFLGL
jgi:phosphoglycerol transferase MdoB-like AlkP superfamily enzyme